jgi:hypothetical protein
VRPRALIILAALVVFFTAAVQAKGVSGRENYPVVTNSKSSVNNFALHSACSDPRAAFERLLVPSISHLLLFPRLVWPSFLAYVSESPEQGCLILQGCAFLVVGVLWLKKTRRATSKQLHS